MPTQSEFEVIHVDNHLLVVNKPAGMLSQGDSTGDRSLVEHAQDWLVDTYNKPGNAFVGLVHRLDRPVGGVMVLARTSKGAARLSDQFRQRRVEKVYWAVVNGIPNPAQQSLEQTLDDKACRLEFRTLRTHKGQTLLEVRPLTGRKHQIRRQLAAAGHWIVGDLRYGADRPLNRHAIALMSRSIGFAHPTTKEQLCFEVSPAPWWPLSDDDTTTR